MLPPQCSDLAILLQRQLAVAVSVQAFEELRDRLRVVTKRRYRLLELANFGLGQQTIFVSIQKLERCLRIGTASRPRHGLR